MLCVYCTGSRGLWSDRMWGYMYTAGSRRWWHW